jgi:hypothetical protein
MQHPMCKARATVLSTLGAATSLANYYISEIMQMRGRFALTQNR